MPHTNYLPGEHECERLNLSTCPVDKTQSFNNSVRTLLLSSSGGNWSMCWHVWVEFSSSQIFLLESWIAPAAYGKNIIYSIRRHWWETNLNFLLAEIDELEATQTLLAQHLNEDVPPQWYKNYLELENNLKEKCIFLD